MNENQKSGIVGVGFHHSEDARFYFDMLVCDAECAICGKEMSCGQVFRSKPVDVGQPVGFVNGLCQCVDCAALELLPQWVAENPDAPINVTECNRAIERLREARKA